MVELEGQFEEAGIDVIIVTADPFERLAAWQRKQQINFRLLADVGHVVADQYRVPIQRRHPAARTYEDGFVLPAMFGYRGEEAIYEKIMQAKLLNGFGAMNRPTGAELLAAMKRELVL